MALYNYPTVSESRRRRRGQLADELGSASAQGIAGLDALAKAQKAAGLETERVEDRKTKKADDLERKKIEAEKFGLEKTKAQADIADAEARRARAAGMDDLQRKKFELEESESRRKAEAESFKLRKAEEESGEAEARKRAAILIAALDDESTDADRAEQILAEVEALGISNEEAMQMKDEVRAKRGDEARGRAMEDAKLGILKRKASAPVGGAGGGMADLKRQKLEADLSLSKARARAAETNAGAGGKAPSTQEALAVAELDTLLGNINVIGEGKKSVDTGPVAGRVGVLKSTLGVGDPKVTAFRSEVGSQLGDYIKAMSGAAASDKERAFLEQNVPTVNDSDEEFDAKLDRVRAWGQRKRSTLLSALTAAKRDVSGFGPGAQAPQGAQMSDEDIADAVMDEMPDATDDEIANQIEWRKRGGR